MGRAATGYQPNRWEMSSRSYAGDRVVVAWLQGEWELDTVTESTLRYLASVTTPATRHLVLDLSGVSFMASRSLSCLLWVHRGGTVATGELHLTGVDGNRTAARVIDLTGLRSVFDIRPDLDELLAELGAMSVAR